MLITVRHRTASSARGDSNVWEYDPSRRVVDIVLRLGAAEPIAFAVIVCSPQRPRFAAHPIVRVDGESWRLLPSRFASIEDECLTTVELHGIAFPWPRDVPLQTVECRRGICPLHAAIGTGTHLILANSPPIVDDELSELASV